MRHPAADWISETTWRVIDFPILSVQVIIWYIIASDNLNVVISSFQHTDLTPSPTWFRGMKGKQQLHTVVYTKTEMFNLHYVNKPKHKLCSRHLEAELSVGCPTNQSIPCCNQRRSMLRGPVTRWGWNSNTTHSAVVCVMLAIHQHNFASV